MIAPIRTPMPRKPLAKRLFSGMAGSPLVCVNPASAVGAPKHAQVGPPKITRMRDMVLLHYCFDQGAGETKKEHCFCEERAERVHRDVAEQYVRDGLADFLIVKNARAKTGTSIFRRALVIRSVVIDDHKLFAVSSRWTPKISRAEKNEAIGVTVRDEAKNLLRRMFAKGVIAQDVFQRLQTDAELDLLFTDRDAGDQFLQMLTRQEQHWFRKQFTKIMLHWWNNVLGFHRLDMGTGTTMKEAPAGVGEIVYKPNANAITDAVRGNPTVSPTMFIPNPLGDEVEFIDNGGRRVAAANHIAKAWDPAGGRDPQKFECGGGDTD